MTLADAWGIAALAILSGFSIYRAHLVDESFGSYVTCPHCFDAAVWANDALLFAAFAIVLAASRVAASLRARVALAIAAAAMASVYIGDILVFRLLDHRLLLIDVVHFARDTGRLWTVAALHFQQAGGLAFALASLALIAVIGLAALAASRATPIAAWPTVAAMLVGAWAAIPQPTYIHADGFRNLWQVNREQDPTRAYSREFWAKADKSPPRLAYCEPGERQAVSVVLVVVESLSACHSRLYCGLHDYTPNLDRLASSSAYFRNFYANGYSTETALIALLTGRVPVPTAGWLGGIMAFTDVDGDFHHWLAGQGYETGFFTSGDIGIGERQRWLRTLGIAHVEGSENPFYGAMPRGSFGAAEDAALIDRFLQWEGERRARTPFMATLLTVATHPPFYSPVTGRQDEAASFREVDRQVGRLASTLGERGFFDHGVMLVVGDHRAMTPIPGEEFERVGPSVTVRVPAIAIGRTGLAAGEHDEPVQQTDVIPSLRHLIADQACRSDWQGQFLGGPVEPARYVVHDDPLRRNEIVLEEANREYRMLLDGDDTRWVEAPPSKDEASAVLDEVNRERMSRMAEFTATERQPAAKPPGK